MSQQGTGVPVERSRRNLSTSAPCPNSDAEPRPEADVQMQQPAQDDKKTPNISQPSQESPRRCESAPRPSSPPAGALSTARDNTSRTSTPHLETTTKSSRKPSHSPSNASEWPKPIEPPVTRATLSELDVTKIIHNPKLRHDINFDPELHFRPNLEGEKGRRKQERAHQFWHSLKKELAMFITDRSTFLEKYAHNNDWTLPTLLKSVKDIVQTLVPHRDRHFLDEGLNIDLLMQQFYKGIADLDKLALWLSQVLKSHCAPMRDEWVDAMYNQLSNGNKESDLDELVNGMRNLLGVLEAMKLDVANHQIRCLRTWLVEDTINFEQKFFCRKLHSKRMDVSIAKKWYRDACQRHAATVTHSAATAFGETAILFEALSRLILPSSTEKRFPNTFLFDDDRLHRIRLDLLDAVNLQVCMKMYDDLERVGRYNYSGALGNSIHVDDAALRPAASPTTAEFNFNTPIETSRPSSINLSPSGSAASSPRSSLHLPVYVAPESNARDLYNSLLAILQSNPSLRQSERWQSMAPSMALQIFRYTKAPACMLSTFEEKLVTTISGMDSPLYKEVEVSLHKRLMAELHTLVRGYRSLSGVALFAAATRCHPHSPTLGLAREKSHEDSVMEDIATRLAHVGILHWRVWAQMAYSMDEDSMVVDSQN